MCAFLRILHGVFDGSRRCVFCYGVCSRGADDCRKRSGGKSVAGSGERSRQHGRCTEHDKSGKCGADRERRSDGCGAGRCRRTDGRGADRCRSAGGCGTEYGVWGRPEYGVHPDGGAESLAAFSYTAAPEAGLPTAATTGSGTLDVSGVSYSGFSKGIAAKGWSEGAGFTVAVNAAGYTDLKFSADMRSSGTGPANFALEYSIDGASWTKISGTDVTLSTSLASVYQQTALPAALSGKAFTLRVTMQGNTSVNQSTVGTNGVTSINNIVVTGTQGEVATDGTVCSKVKASVEPGDVEAGTKVELSCATEGATITYHTDLDSADKTYTEALVIEEDVTIYATAELEGYETSETKNFPTR